jgi:hypothetical protein
MTVLQALQPGQACMHLSAMPARPALNMSLSVSSVFHIETASFLHGVQATPFCVKYMTCHGVPFS